VIQNIPLAPEELWGREFWSDGYYGGDDWNVVERCVANQSINPEAVQLRLFKYPGDVCWLIT